MWPSLLVLVRHAESEGNIIDGDSRASFNKPTWAYSLTKNGIDQAKKTKEYLHRIYDTFDVYYTSYYNRSKETMQVLYPDLKVYEDPRLAEAQRGIYHTMTREQIAAKYPEELERKEKEGLYHYRPPGGENWPDVEMRIHSFLGTLSRDYGYKKVLVVVHGHWLVLFERLIHRFSIEEAVKRYKSGPAENASVTSYRSKFNLDNGQDRLVFDGYMIPWK